MTNKQQIWEKSTILTMRNSILLGLREYKMSRRKTIKVRMVPSAKVIISSPVIRVDKANFDINNKKFISLLNSTCWDCINHENFGESHLNEYGLHINRAGSITLANNLISRIQKF